MTWHPAGLVRLSAGLALVGLVAVGCAGDSPSASTGNDPARQASTKVAPPPSLTAADEVDLTARALLELCTRRCADMVGYVHDSSFTIDTLAGDETALPEETRAAIEAQLPAVVFVDAEEADALFGADALTAGGRGILMSVGPCSRPTSSGSRWARSPPATVARAAPNSSNGTAGRGSRPNPTRPASPPSPG